MDDTDWLTFMDAWHNRCKTVMASCRFHLWISPITRIDIVICHTWVDTWQDIAIDANGQLALFFCRHLIGKDLNL